jgi:hypothetical protein
MGLSCHFPSSFVITISRQHGPGPDSIPNPINPAIKRTARPGHIRPLIYCRQRVKTLSNVAHLVPLAPRLVGDSALTLLTPGEPSSRAPDRPRVTRRLCCTRPTTTSLWTRLSDRSYFWFGDPPEIAFPSSLKSTPSPVVRMCVRERERERERYANLVTSLGNAIPVNFGTRTLLASGPRGGLLKMALNI